MSRGDLSGLKYFDGVTIKRGAYGKEVSDGQKRNAITVGWIRTPTRAPPSPAIHFRLATKFPLRNAMLLDPAHNVQRAIRASCASSFKSPHHGAPATASIGIPQRCDSHCSHCAAVRREPTHCPATHRSNTTTKPRLSSTGIASMPGASTIAFIGSVPRSLTKRLKSRQRVDQVLVGLGRRHASMQHAQ